MAWLHCVILNSNEGSQPSTSSLYLELVRWRRRWPPGRGDFTLAGESELELRLFRGERQAVMGLRQAGKGIALAMHAWGGAESEICWDELGQQHDRMVRAWNRPSLRENRPPGVPWLAISFAPTFFEAALVAQVQRGVTLLATVALLIAEEVAAE